MYGRITDFDSSARNYFTKNYSLTLYDPGSLGVCLKQMMGQLQKVWNFGINLSIDKATVLYKGHDIPFVMYNPKKLIIHGTKVSSLYVLYLFSLYILITIITNIFVQILALCFVL